MKTKKTKSVTRVIIEDFSRNGFIVPEHYLELDFGLGDTANRRSIKQAVYRIRTGIEKHYGVEDPIHYCKDFNRYVVTSERAREGIKDAWAKNINRNCVYFKPNKAWAGLNKRHDILYSVAIVLWIGFFLYLVAKEIL